MLQVRHGSSADSNVHVTAVTLRPAAFARLYRARESALRLPAVRAPVVLGSA
jgi:hypothetical protein